MKNEIANTIARQLGFSLKMIGAKNLIAYPDGLAFKIGRNAKRVNHIKITLENDLYTMTFSRVPSVKALCNGKETVIVKQIEMVYADQMNTVIESNTGMYTRL